MVVALIVVLGVSILAFLWVIRDMGERHAHELAAFRMEAATERQTLLERIQRPERPVFGPQPDLDLPEPEPDEAHLVGTITFGEDQ